MERHSHAATLAPRTMKLFIAAALSCLCACESNRALYSWGHYQDSVYGVCHGGAAFEPAKDAEILSQEVDQLSTSGFRVAPGVHAHLGYLYYLTGNSAAAVAQFNAEKELYPESATFIDGMLSRMKS